MTSQKKGIAVGHYPDAAGYRLIELPVELQSLLESDSAPVLVTLPSDESIPLR